MQQHRAMGGGRQRKSGIGGGREAEPAEEGQEGGVAPADAPQTVPQQDRQQQHSADPEAQRGNVREAECRGEAEP